MADKKYQRQHKDEINALLAKLEAMAETADGSIDAWQDQLNDDTPKTGQHISTQPSTPA